MFRGVRVSSSDRTRIIHADGLGTYAPAPSRNVERGNVAVASAQEGVRNVVGI